MCYCGRDAFLIHYIIALEVPSPSHHQDPVLKWSKLRGAVASFPQALGIRVSAVVRVSNVTCGLGSWSVSVSTLFEYNIYVYKYQYRSLPVDASNKGYLRWHEKKKKQ